MKKMILLPLLFIGICLSTTVSASGFQVISDFDDTMKRSNIPDGAFRTFGRVFLWEKVYAGIPELYQEFKKNHSGLYVLSASPWFVSGSIKDTLEEFKIEINGLFTRGPLELLPGKKIPYKLENIKSVLKGNSDQLILLGDNVEADHEVYIKIKEENVGRVAAIYIRKIYNQELPDGIVGFFSTFEVAAREFSKGRLTIEQVEKVAKGILEEKVMRRIIPYYAYCPTNMNEFSPVLFDKEDAETHYKLYKMEFLIQLKITNHCVIRVAEELLEQNQSID